MIWWNQWTAVTLLLWVVLEVCPKVEERSSDFRLNAERIIALRHIENDGYVVGEWSVLNLPCLARPST